MFYQLPSILICKNVVSIFPTKFFAKYLLKRPVLFNF
jgi:hypothetical protein